MSSAQVLGYFLDLRLILQGFSNLIVSMGYRLIIAPPAMPEIEVSASTGQGFDVSMKAIQAQPTIQSVVVDFTNHLSGIEDALPHLVELRTLLLSRGGGVLLRCSRAQVGKTGMGGRLESLGFKWEFVEDLPLPPAATFGPKLIATSHQLAQALKRAGALAREKTCLGKPTSDFRQEPRL
jgi:hypothetical protein